MSEENKKFDIDGEDREEAVEEEKALIEEDIPSIEGESDGKEVREVRKISLYSFVCSAIALVLAAVMVTYTFCNSMYKQRLAEAKLQNIVVGNAGEFDELELLSALFKQYSYYDIDEDEIVQKVLNAYVDATGDKYAEYYNAEEYAALRASNAGENEGIGISITKSVVNIEGDKLDAIQVIGVSAGSPAEEADIRVGDKIVWIGKGEDKELVGDIGYDVALTKLKGTSGSVAEFTILRDKEGSSKPEEIGFSVTRAAVESVSVYSAVSEADSSVGIIKISSFDLTAPTQFSKAVDDLESKGCTKFVFDVRYNPGGDLASITAVLSYFLEEGDRILSTLDRAGTEEITYVKTINYEDDYSACNVSEDDIGKYSHLKGNIVVLCNETTASAAELFTAAMRDYELAEIVGVKTYGKGSMQSIISLSYFGYSGALKLTTKMYFPPCAEGYDGEGISPKEENTVELSAEAKKYGIYLLPQSIDDQLIAALEILK